MPKFTLDGEKTDPVEMVRSLTKALFFAIFLFHKIPAVAQDTLGLLLSRVTGLFSI